jgi:hypothetical protein
VRKIKPVFSKFRLGEQPEYYAKTLEEGWRELEEIRRLYPEMGNPDLPIVKNVQKRKSQL